MSKDRPFRYLRSSGGALAAVLCVTMASFGCTTDQMLGNGQPERSSPHVRSAPTAGVTSASEQPVMPPPMTSSVSVNMTATRSRGMTRLHPDEAAAIMAGRQASSQRWRVLGRSDPGFPNRPYVSGSQASASGTMISASTPYTVNQTPFSQQVPGVAADAGAGSDGGTTGSVIVGGVTDLVGIAGTPTVVSGGLPPLTAMTSSSVAATTSASTAGPVVTGRSTRGTTATAIRTGTPSVGVANPVRIVPQNSGRVLITNVTARATSNQ